MAMFLYIDNANLLIGGRFYSAVVGGKAKNIDWARKENIFDRRWHYSYERVIELALQQTQENTLAKAVTFRSVHFNKKHQQGRKNSGQMEVVTLVRTLENDKEKGVDVALSNEILNDALSQLTELGDTIVLIAGDRDYFDTIQRIVARGNCVTVMAWSHTLSGEIKRICSNFIELDCYFKQISSNHPVNSPIQKSCPQITESAFTTTDEKSPRINVNPSSESSAVQSKKIEPIQTQNTPAITTPTPSVNTSEWVAKTTPVSIYQKVDRPTTIPVVNQVQPPTEMDFPQLPPIKMRSPNSCVCECHLQYDRNAVIWANSPPTRIYCNCKCHCGDLYFHCYDCLDCGEHCGLDCGCYCHEEESDDD